MPIADHMGLLSTQAGSAEEQCNLTRSLRQPIGEGRKGGGKNTACGRAVTVTLI